MGKRGDRGRVSGYGGTNATAYAGDGGVSPRLYSTILSGVTHIYALYYLNHFIFIGVEPGYGNFKGMRF